MVLQAAGMLRGSHESRGGARELRRHLLGLGLITRELGGDVRVEGRGLPSELKAVVGRVVFAG